MPLPNEELSGMSSKDSEELSKKISAALSADKNSGEDPGAEKQSMKAASSFAPTPGYYKSISM